MTMGGCEGDGGNVYTSRGWQGQAGRGLRSSSTRGRQKHRTANRAIVWRSKTEHTCGVNARAVQPRR